MNGIDYTLIRGRRRSICITIKDDNTVVVRCPTRTPLSEVENFIARKSKWIESHLAANNVKNGFLSGVLAYESVFVKGKAVPLSVGEPDRFGEDGVSVRNLGRLKKLFCDNLGDEFLRLFYRIADENDFYFKSVSFRSYKSRWGCCSRDKDITFNYKLLMLPEEIWRSVIVHELCHTLEMNHSLAFYEKVISVMADYKKIHSKLKLYSRVCSLY